jgi:hypothetical protein
VLINKQLMTVIFQIEAMNELEEIREWLSKRNIVIHQVKAPKIEVDAFLKRIQRYRISLPQNYNFNRDQANER